MIMRYGQTDTSPTPCTQISAGTSVPLSKHTAVNYKQELSWVKLPPWAAEVYVDLIQVARVFLGTKKKVSLGEKRDDMCVRV